MKENETKIGQIYKTPNGNMFMRIDKGLSIPLGNVDRRRADLSGAVTVSDSTDVDILSLADVITTLETGREPQYLSRSIVCRYCNAPATQEIEDIRFNVTFCLCDEHAETFLKDVVKSLQEENVK